MRLELLPISPPKRHRLLESFVAALSAEPDSRVVRGGFAYATLGGVQTFLASAAAAPNWALIDKEFVIGIHHAISEPSALELLRSVPRLKVRAFVPGNKLALDAFHAFPVFHPKVIAISSGVNVRFLQAGSTNMSTAAMAKKPKNHEFSLAVESDTALSLDAEGRFNKWWSTIWRDSRNVDKPFIAKYAELRRQVLEKNPMLRDGGEAPSAIAKAAHFFIEVGAGSGPPGARHQVEFPESLARFFGRVTRNRRNIALKRGLQTWLTRPLSYKKTTFGVEIWRLGMPTQATGGDPVANRAIQFTRTSVSGTYGIEVTNVGSPAFDEWVRLSNLRGHLGSTHGLGARRYGFY